MEIEVYYYDGTMHTSFKDCMLAARKHLAGFDDAPEYLSLTDDELSDKLYKDGLYYYSELPLSEVLEEAKYMAEVNKDCCDFIRGLHEQINPPIDEHERIKNLLEAHEKIRNILIEYGVEEHGDCIIDEICIAVGIDTTTNYYEED